MTTLTRTQFMIEDYAVMARLINYVKMTIFFFKSAEPKTNFEKPKTNVDKSKTNVAVFLLVIKPT